MNAPSIFGGSASACPATRRRDRPTGVDGNVAFAAALRGRGRERVVSQTVQRRPLEAQQGPVAGRGRFEAPFHRRETGGGCDRVAPWHTMSRGDRAHPPPLYPHRARAAHRGHRHGAGRRRQKPGGIRIGTAGRAEGREGAGRLRPHPHGAPSRPRHGGGGHGQATRVCRHGSCVGSQDAHCPVKRLVKRLRASAAPAPLHGFGRVSLLRTSLETDRDDTPHIRDLGQDLPIFLRF